MFGKGRLAFSGDLFAEILGSAVQAVLESEWRDKNKAVICYVEAIAPSAFFEVGGAFLILLGHVLGIVTAERKRAGAFQGCHEGFHSSSIRKSCHVVSNLGPSRWKKIAKGRSAFQLVALLRKGPYPGNSRDLRNALYFMRAALAAKFLVAPPPYIVHSN